MVSTLNEIQQKVFQELKAVDSKIAEMYYGAIQVLDIDTNSNLISQDSEVTITPAIKYSNPDKIAQSSHSIREALKHLFRSIEVPERDENFRARIRTFADPQKALPNYLYQLHDKLYTLHNWFVNVSHHRYSPTEEEYNKNFELCSSILLRILTPHFESESEIDGILSESNPTDSHLQTLESLMTNFQLYNYVFRNAGVQWLPLLRRGPFFKNPPVPKRSGQYVQFPSWPESQYLTRIVAELPKDVYEIISKCDIPVDKDERNPRVFEDFLEAGLKMPCEHASQLSKLILDQQWEDRSSFSLLGEKLSDLMTKLSDECDEVNLAVALGDLVLDVELVSINPIG